MNILKRLMMMVFIFVLTILVIMIIDNVLLSLYLGCTGLDYNNYYALTSSIYTIGGLIGIFMYIIYKK